MAHLSVIKNRSSGLVGQAVSLKTIENGRGFKPKWTWLLIYCAHLARDSVAEPPFCIRHCKLIMRARVQATGPHIHKRLEAPQNPIKMGT